MLGRLPMYGKRHVIRVPVRGGGEGSEEGLNESLGQNKYRTLSASLRVILSQGISYSS